MKTITEYLSGSFDSELRVLVAEARGWTKSDDQERWTWRRPDGRDTNADLPCYSVSRDACEELLANLTDEEISKVWYIWHGWFTHKYTGQILRATARQICVAWLIVKGVLK